MSLSSRVDEGIIKLKIYNENTAEQNKIVSKSFIQI